MKDSSEKCTYCEAKVNVRDCVAIRIRVGKLGRINSKTLQL